MAGGTLSDAEPEFTDSLRTATEDRRRLSTGEDDRAGLPIVSACGAYGSDRVNDGPRSPVRCSLFAALADSGLAICPGGVVSGPAGVGSRGPWPLDPPGWLAARARGRLVRADQSGFLSGRHQARADISCCVFYATCPLVVLLLAWGFRMERPDLQRLSGVLLSVAGIVVIGIGHYLEKGSYAAPAGQSVMLSDLLLLGTVASWGGYIAVSKPLVVRHGAITVLAGTVLTGLILSTPFAFLGLPSWESIRAVPVSAWTALIVLGLFITPFAWAYQNLAHCGGLTLARSPAFSTHRPS